MPYLAMKRSKLFLNNLLFAYGFRVKPKVNKKNCSRLVASQLLMANNMKEKRII